MSEYCLGNRDGTVDTSLSPVRAPEIEILKKKFLTEKRKCAHTIQGTSMVPLTPSFYLCDLQKSRYRRNIFWTEKQKCAHCLGNRDCTGDTFLSPVRPQEIEILKKNFGSEKRNYAHTVQGIAMVPLTLFFHLCELRKSRYQRKNFLTEKGNARTLFRKPRWDR